ncbi:hypothetical protein ACQR18_07900 [Bradyrhizobium oligotrophicum]|uniref:hypothetical protein n=1 Tax=Bradyrhizobium oligotrophicum TaxID=44255 RepID=UPI003EB9431F
MTHRFNVDPRNPYDGPDFDEFCIAEKSYLSARRDRSDCIACALSKLCQAGFEHQVDLAAQGRDPSLTKDCQLTAEDLTAERLFDGLTDEQVDFVKTHIPGLAKEHDNV